VGIAHRARRDDEVDPRLPVAWEIGVVVLTIAGVVAVFLEWGLEESSAWLDSVYIVDDVICGFLLLDFGVRFKRSSDRKTFFKRWWIDLVGSIPLVGPLRMIRLVRLFRIVRLLRAARLARRVFGFDSQVLSRTFGNLGVMAALLWVGTASAFYVIEHGTNPNIRDFEDALWWAMTTLSTVGYGDVYPTTQAGRLVALLTMVLGVGVLGTLAATLAAAMIDLRDRGRRGLGRHAVSHHLLLLGWNARSAIALSEFRLDPRYAELPIIVIADLESSPTSERGVRFVRGVPSRREVLERASAAEAELALVFARDPIDPRSDHETALVVLALRKLNPRVRIAVELVDTQNHDLLADVGSDTVVDAARFSASLLVRGVQDIGVSDVVGSLLASDEGSELYRVPVPTELVGRTYRECALAFVDRRNAVIGIVRGQERTLNPDNALVLEAGDELFVVAPEPP
jgi:voltage-gated potassium channel